MTTPLVARHKTALTRNALSRPFAVALADNLLSRADTVFDYGCGKGDDIRHLRALGCEADGWDPTHRPGGEHRSAGVVNLGFVLNVIERPSERSEVLERAWRLAERLLVVSARMTWDARGLAGRPMGDGVLTRTGTFQKFFAQNELAQLIEQTLHVKPHAAAPGVFYVFRNEEHAQRFVASRVYTYRPRVTINPHDQYESVRDALEPLLSFMQQHARAPKADELAPASLEAIMDAMGSIGRAQQLIRQVTEDDHWGRVLGQRRTELLTYVALSRFAGRPRASQLDRSLSADIRAVFGSYREACLQADRLLLACGDQTMLHVNARGSKVGKQTPSALYVHRSAVARMSPLLQVYEGCARALVGTIASANMIKLSVGEPQISYLIYPSFDRDPHPTLAASLTVNLRRLSVQLRDYGQSENPPLLHRKEEFLDEDHPRRHLYERLTRAEIRAGLYARPERIGTLSGWRATLEEAGHELRGHRLVRRRA